MQEYLAEKFEIVAKFYFDGGGGGGSMEWWGEHGCGVDDEKQAGETIVCMNNE